MSESVQEKGFTRFINHLFKAVEVIIAIFLGAMIFFTFLNVVLRQFGMGFAWSEELTRICFIYLVYLGAIIAARENRHLMIDTLLTKLPPKARPALYLLIQGIIIWMMGVLASGAFQNAWKNRNDFWVATGFPVFMVHFAGVLLGVSVIIISLVNLYHVFIKKESVLKRFGVQDEEAESSTDGDLGEGAGLQ